MVSREKSAQAKAQSTGGETLTATDGSRTENFFAAAPILEFIPAFDAHENYL
jgi:hypothetical protein